MKKNMFKKPFNVMVTSALVATTLLTPTVSMIPSAKAEELEQVKQSKMDEHQNNEETVPSPEQTEENSQTTPERTEEKETNEEPATPPVQPAVGEEAPTPTEEVTDTEQEENKDVKEEVQGIVTIPDANLRAKIKERLGVQNDADITHERMANMTGIFTISEKLNIQSLSGLEYATGLTRLEILNNPFSDVTPLQNLTNLTNLNLASNKIQDVTPLQNLTNLKELRLYGNQISDVTPLIKLTNLTTLLLNTNWLTQLPMELEGKVTSIANNFIDNKNGQYAYSLAESTIKIKKGERKNIKVNWTHNGIASQAPGHIPLSPRVTSENRDIVSAAGTLGDVLLTGGNEVGTTVVTYEPVPGLQKTVTVEVEAADVELEAPEVDDFYEKDRYVTGTVKDGTKKIQLHDEAGNLVKTGTVKDDNTFEIYVYDKNYPVGTNLQAVPLDASNKPGKTTPFTVKQKTVAPVDAPDVNEYYEREGYVTGTVKPGTKKIQLHKDGVLVKTGAIETDGTFKIYAGDQKYPAGTNLEAVPFGENDVRGQATPFTVNAIDDVGAPTVNDYHEKESYITGTVASGTKKIQLHKDGVLVKTGAIETDGTFRIYAGDQKYPVGTNLDIVPLNQADRPGTTTSITVISN